MKGEKYVKTFEDYMDTLNPSDDRAKKEEKELEEYLNPSADKEENGDDDEKSK